MVGVLLEGGGFTAAPTTVLLESCADRANVQVLTLTVVKAVRVVGYATMDVAAQCRLAARPVEYGWPPVGGRGGGRRRSCLGAWCGHVKVPPNPRWFRLLGAWNRSVWDIKSRSLKALGRLCNPKLASMR